jgi:alkylation response protein AidB-like acyl-CoA dehydrogenase
MASELGHDPELWKRISAELGWPAVAIPESCGGLGLSWVELAALLELAGEYLLCAPLFSTTCLGASVLLVAGSEAQRAEHLPGIAQGRTLATLAWLEEGGRPEPEGIGALALRQGGEIVLSGRKRFVVDGHCADLLVVAAREPGSRGAEGIGLYLVPGDAPGLERRSLPTLDPTRRLAALELRDLRLPAAARLGGEEAGFDALEGALDLARVGLAAEMVGGAQRCLDLAVEHAKTRLQFGRPIGSFQAIQHMCADMLVRLESARSAAYYGACVAAEGGAELDRAASLAKACASEAFFHCAAQALQILGGLGFTWEADVQLHLKRARASESFLGDPSWHRERIARRLDL